MSRHWADADGKTGRIQPDGSVVRVPPHRLGAIGNGHHVKFSNSPEIFSSWDFTFEQQFAKADDGFPAVIAWLESLDRRMTVGSSLHDRFAAQPATNDQLCALTESIVSLVVRSPMNRDTFGAFADFLGHPVSTAERNAVIGLNMRSSQRVVSDSIGARGKYAVLYSTNREFIYGDGCFNNVHGSVNPPRNPKMLVPVTPRVAVIVCRPMSFVVEPRLSTIVLTDNEVEICNQAIHVYSRAEIFFRSETPELHPAFVGGERCKYSHPDNSIDVLLRAIPGILPETRR